MASLLRPQTTDDENLVRGLRSGKHAAFERLYGTYRAPIYNLCARIIGDREEAQDVTQEVFLKAFSKVPSEGRLALRPWLYRVATNACLNHLRSRGRAGGDGLEVEEIASQVDGFAQSQTVAYVEETLAQLNDRYRTALVLKDLHGLPSAEIASVLELPRGSTDVLVHRARAAFKRVFSEVSGGGASAPANLGLVLGPLACRRRCISCRLRCMRPWLRLRRMPRLRHRCIPCLLWVTRALACWRSSRRPWAPNSPSPPWRPAWSLAAA